MGEQLECLRKDNNSKGKIEFPCGKGGRTQKDKKVICLLHLPGQVTFSLWPSLLSFITWSGNHLIALLTLSMLLHFSIFLKQ